LKPHVYDSIYHFNIRDNNVNMDIMACVRQYGPDCNVSLVDMRSVSLF
jgi:ubiquitin-protein ligase